MTKPQLYEIIKFSKPPPKYKVDSYLESKGHEVLRLPPYNCDLNPIELIWGDLKSGVARENSTLKLSDVKDLVHEGFKRIDKKRWENVCQHVIEKVEAVYWKEDGVHDEVNKIIINLDSDSEDETDDDIFYSDEDSS